MNYADCSQMLQRHRPAAHSERIKRVCVLAGVAVSLALACPSLQSLAAWLPADTLSSSDARVAVLEASERITGKPLSLFVVFFLCSKRRIQFQGLARKQHHPIVCFVPVPCPNPIYNIGDQTPKKLLCFFVIPPKDCLRPEIVFI
jgi:hypothetical protein